MIAMYMKVWELSLNTNVRYFVKGKNGDLFPNYPLAPTVENYLGLNPISNELLEIVKLNAAGTQAFWALNGAHYVMAIAPDKVTIYPENLPSLLSTLHSKSKYEQVVDVLKNTPINFLNLKEALERYKVTANVYNKKFDLVHWNGYGLEVAYKELCKFTQ